MEGFITFLFFLCLFVLVMRKLFPLLLTWFIKKKIKDGTFVNGGFYGQGFGAGQQPPRSDYGKDEEGKVIISDIPKQDKVIDKGVGEYVDFEE